MLVLHLSSDKVGSYHLPEANKLVNSKYTYSIWAECIRGVVDIRVLVYLIHYRNIKLDLDIVMRQECKHFMFFLSFQ